MSLGSLYGSTPFPSPPEDSLSPPVEELEVIVPTFISRYPVNLGSSGELHRCQKMGDGREALQR